jgi:hypothetical protein
MHPRLHLCNINLAVTSPAPPVAAGQYGQGRGGHRTVRGAAVLREIQPRTWQAGEIVYNPAV